MGQIGATTEFGSQQVLSVAARRGAWLAVVTSALPNGQLAWVRRDGVTLRRTRWSLHADLSEHTLTLLRYGRAVRRIDVAIGRAGLGDSDGALRGDRQDRRARATAPTTAAASWR